MDLKRALHIVLDCECDCDLKIFILFLIDKIDFNKNIHNQYVSISFNFIKNKIGWCDQKSQKIIKNSISNGYIFYKKGGYEIKNSPNSYCLTPKIFEEYEQKIEKSRGLKMDNIPMWCRDLATIWVDWRQSLGLEHSWPMEEYAYYIADAYHLIPNDHTDGTKVDKEKWMNNIFDLITYDDYWKNACSTPHQLKEKAKGAYKIQRLFTQATSKKNLIKIKLKELEKDDSPEIIF